MASNKKKTHTKQQKQPLTDSRNQWDDVRHQLMFTKSAKKSPNRNDHEAIHMFF